MKRISVILYLAMLTSTLSAQEFTQESYQPHEFILAFGMVSSPEKSVFNVPANDVAASPDFSYYAGYYYSLSENLAVGGHIAGYSQTINNVAIIDASSSFKIVSFDLFPYNLGVQVRYLLMAGVVQPFVSGSASLAAGTLQNKEYGTLTMLGFSVGATAGARVFIFDAVSLCLQGFASFGSASFKQKPFLNSVGKEFNPSMMGVNFGAAYHWY